MFTHTINPKPEDIDVMGHVNNVEYLRYVQEVAEAHWKTNASDQQQKEILWVVLRHEIDYKKPAFLQDEIAGTTWIDSPEGPKIRRHVELRRVFDNTVLAKATTVWCAIEASSGRPMRLNDKVFRIFTE